MAFKSFGGPAFPVVANNVVYDHGMYLRDYFAAQALPAVIGGWGDVSPPAGETWDQMVARMSYEIADAMLKHRETR